MTPKDASCVTQNEKAKSKDQIIAQVARIVRKAGLDYEGWRYISKRVRKYCDLKPKKKGRKLPKVLNTDEFERFYEMVDRADNAQHSLMLRLLFFTAVRVSELCNMQTADVDLAANKIRINDGKGGKDRYVLFNKQFSTALRTHMAANPNSRWLFQTRRNSNYSTRRVQQIVKQYAEEAGVKATPHVFRHQAISWLTKKSGMADAELQLITGHARRETLAIYQHIALDDELEDKYQNAMSGVQI